MVSIYHENMWNACNFTLTLSAFDGGKVFGFDRDFRSAEIVSPVSQCEFGIDVVCSPECVCVGMSSL